LQSLHSKPNVGRFSWIVTSGILKFPPKHMSSNLETDLRSDDPEPRQKTQNFPSYLRRTLVLSRRSKRDVITMDFWYFSPTTPQCVLNSSNAYKFLPWLLFEMWNIHSLQEKRTQDSSHSTCRLKTHKLKRINNWFRGLLDYHPFWSRLWCHPFDWLNPGPWLLFAGPCSPGYHRHLDDLELTP